MFKLILQNNSLFINRLEDWETLRNEYRIIGEFVGLNCNNPALPLKLLPEEVYLLLDKNIASVVTSENEQTRTDDSYKRRLLDAERAAYIRMRKNQVLSYFDKILEGKRKKGDQRSQQEIFREELEKAVTIDEENMLWPILLYNPSDYGKEVASPKDKIIELTTRKKCLVYKDLWERGYYITPGEKFGADFLVYKGDPIMYHAMLVVKCVDTVNEPLFTSELVAFGRLGSSVKKKGILATVDNDNIVKYITLHWIDS